MAFGRLDALQQLDVLDAVAFVLEIRARLERGAELRESPSFDQAYFCLRDVAARELVEELDRRDRLRDLVVAGLDVTLASEQAGKRFEVVRLDAHAGTLEERDRAAQALARGNLDLGGFGRHADRRADVPSGIA